MSTQDDPRHDDGTVEVHGRDVFLEVFRVEQRVRFSELSRRPKAVKYSFCVLYVVTSLATADPIPESVVQQVFNEVQTTVLQVLEEEAERNLLMFRPMAAIIDDEVEDDALGGRTECPKIVKIPLIRDERMDPLVVEMTCGVDVDAVYGREGKVIVPSS